MDNTSDIVIIVDENQDKEKINILPSRCNGHQDTKFTKTNDSPSIDIGKTSTLLTHNTPGSKSPRKSNQQNSSSNSNELLTKSSKTVSNLSSDQQNTPLQEKSSVPLIRIPAVLPNTISSSEKFTVSRQSNRNRQGYKYQGTGITPRTLRLNSDGTVAGTIKTIQRRGNTYMIWDLPASDDFDEDEIVETDVTEQMIDDLYNDTMNLSTLANNKATLYKYIYVISTLFVIIAGAVIGVLSSQDVIGNESSSSSATKIVISVFGFVITGIGTCMTTFSIEKRGVLLKDVSNKLRKVSRQIKTLQYSEMKPKDKILKLEEFYAEVDDMDLSIYDNNILSPPVSKSPVLPITSKEDLSSLDVTPREQLNQSSEISASNNQTPIRTRSVFRRVRKYSPDSDHSQPVLSQMQMSA